MSYLFDGVDDSLAVDAAVVTDPPFTMACWFYPTDLTLEGTLMGVADKDFAARYHSLISQGNVAGDPLRAHSAQGAGAGAASSTSQTEDVWQHACGVWASTTDRRVFLNGGGKVTDTTSVTPTGMDRTFVGERMSSTPQLPFTGRIAHPAVWNTDLTDAEVARLAAGAHPFKVRPASLVAYWRLVLDSNASVGANNLTASGAVLDSSNPTLAALAMSALGVG